MSDDPQAIPYYAEGVQWRDITGGVLSLRTFADVPLLNISIKDANGHINSVAIQPSRLREIAAQLTSFADRLEVF